ncbi:hypothetical protein RHP75_15740 [Pseudomonas sp. SG20056]|uniref:DUF7210 family protein n=1 Tax=Pseudomonas sp. SG20056 TaxID=3074146 RepID=UPI00287FE7A1|nr:hypothetical protein [Pseudomonas sp. SG20056]WNF45817.1 hypothetical protein RHP75_15740 [Pseudomonas sp. SG20056]
MTQRTTAPVAGDAVVPPKGPELIEVTLVKTHNHAGKPCKVDDKIQVTARQKAFLEGAGIIEKKGE